MSKAAIPPAEFGKVAVLYGGDSAERDVSIQSGQAVFEALISRGVNAHLVDTVDRSAVLALKDNGFDRAFIMLHGRGGEDGQIQGVLEWLNLPYTGSGILACAIAMDKTVTKKLWSRSGLPVLKDKIVSIGDDYLALCAELGASTFVIKPALEGSSVGISQVSNQAELDKALEKAGAAKQKVMAEPWVVGRELTCAVLDGKMLPSIEIVASDSHAFYDYEAKYIADDTRYICPAPIPADLEEELRTLTAKAFSVLGCKGWGRVDYMLDSHERPWLLEINLAPGMTSHSLLPQAAAKVGMSFADVVMTVLAQTLSTNG